MIRCILLFVLSTVFPGKLPCSKCRWSVSVAWAPNHVLKMDA